MNTVFYHMGNPGDNIMFPVYLYILKIKLVLSEIIR